MTRNVSYCDKSLFQCFNSVYSDAYEKYSSGETVLSEHKSENKATAYVYGLTPIAILPELS